VIGPSQFIADMLVRLGCPPAKAHVCACGIDADRFAAGEGVPFNVLAVGRLVEKKAPHATIDAFAKIAGRFPDARLDIVGDGPLRKRCDELIRNLGLEGRVVLHGAKSHDFVAELFRRASVFVQHSVTTPLGDVEGMPVSVLEAMASGLPVVSTMHSGIQEAVVSGETGLLVRERDVEGMASAIAALLENPGRAAEMGARGRERVLMRYTQEKSAEKLRSIMGL
ncbi:MAG: glycosyltransferase, partial [Oricola sp.]|nr:glycosyltransferase [Oricola sp.]